ncbi:hypothetical protein PSU4_20510 [Pseudonocardia sulfidoxydans NBRC 16205]|uniref:ABC transmembrane type-1 domain-containing protein n=1 Tax=Pseudonocardia sulfidoxydans NBRC 16205 TaxID=1223511 RepID=A0A511DEX7_9PSEU|nr:ABC transporter permease subunit [Pseudonocardia sulfidoxydans]GEL23097.1 hypothetical protein PSU4_20510 [Pseudonocardia sulfidoxydans NBRC 16205]
MRWPGTRVASGVLAVLLVVIVVGPLVAPYDPAAPVGLPYEPPTPQALLGTDALGRDLLSRILDGGLPMLGTALAGAVAGSALGTVAGLLAAWWDGRSGRSRWVEGAVLRPLDTLAIVPPMLLVLLILTAFTGHAGLVLAVALTGVPLSARVLRAAAAPVVTRAHVEAAVARGEGPAWIVGRELLPLVAGPLVADLGIRFVAAIYVVTAAGFLGVGPSGTDWGTLIVEALPGVELAPLLLAVPVVLVALLAVSVTVLADDAVRRSRAVLA